MSTTAFLGLMATLALGGFDPAPALIAGVFLAAAAPSSSSSLRRQQVLQFALVLIGGTAMWGVVLTLTFGAQLHEVNYGSGQRGGRGRRGAAQGHAGLAPDGTVLHRNCDH